MSHSESPGLQLRSKKTTKNPGDKAEETSETLPSPSTMSMTTRRRGEQQSAVCKIGSTTDQTPESHGETETSARRRSTSTARTPLTDPEGSMELRRRSSSTTSTSSKSDKSSTPGKPTPDSRSTKTPTGKTAERGNTPASSPARRSERQNSTGSTGDKSTPTSSKTPSSDGKGFEKIIKTRAAAQVLKSGTDSKPDTPLKPPPLKYEGPGVRKRSHITSPEAKTDKTGGASEGHPPSKKKRTIRKSPSGQETENDFFCWMCHKEGNVICCELCPRVYHARCLGVDKGPPGDWVCPECQKIMQAECTDTRSKAMTMLSSDQLCMLLKFALQRMKNQGSEPFHKPVDIHDEPNYSDYIFNPMDMMTLEKNIKKKMYGSTEAFLADTKWILHNCIIYNGMHHKLTTCAKAIMKICRHEMSEIEVCPDCYTNSCLKKNDNWFCEPCSTPHPLVWSKLKGYPFWPAKALRVMNNQVDVRFFGAHDRAWVPMSQVYLLSKEPPVPMKNKKSGYEESMEELELHISRIKDKFASFIFSPFRTPYDSAHPYNAFKANKNKSPLGSPAKKLKLSSPVGSPSKSTTTRSSSSGLSSPISPRKTGTGSRLQGMKRSVMGTEEKVVSIVSKTASAVKSKYNTFSSRRAERALLQSVSDQSDEEKTISRKTAVDPAEEEETEESPQSESLPREKASIPEESTEILDTNSSRLSNVEKSGEKLQKEKPNETKSVSASVSDAVDLPPDRFSESGEKDTKSESGEKDTKSESGEKDTKSESGEKDTESESCEKDSKWEPGEMDTKSESGEKDSKSEPGEKDTKLELGEKQVLLEVSKKDIGLRDEIMTDDKDSDIKGITGESSAYQTDLDISKEADLDKDTSVIKRTKSGKSDGGNIPDIDSPSDAVIDIQGKKESPGESDIGAPSGSESDSLPKGDKKNPFLENLVESCKAKLGITNEEQLQTGEDSAIEEEEEVESGEAEDSGKTSGSSSSSEDSGTSDSCEDEEERGGEEERDENENGDHFNAGKTTSPQPADSGEDPKEDETNVPVKTGPDSASEITADTLDKESMEDVEKDTGATKKKVEVEKSCEENKDIEPATHSERLEEEKMTKGKSQDDNDSNSNAEIAPVTSAEHSSDNSQKTILEKDDAEKSGRTTEVDNSLMSKVTSVSKPEDKSPSTSKETEEPMDISETVPEQLSSEKEKECFDPKDSSVADGSVAKRKRDQLETDSFSDSDESNQLVIDLSQEESDAGKSLRKQVKVKIGPKSAGLSHGVAIRAKEQAWRERQWQRKVQLHKGQTSPEIPEESSSRAKAVTPTLPTVLPTSPDSGPAVAPAPTHSPPIRLDPLVASQPSGGQSTSSAPSHTTAALPETSLSSSLAPSLSNLLPGFDLNKYTSRVMDSVKNSLEDLYNDIMSSEANGLIMKSVTQEMQKLQWRHFQELKEMRHNIDLTVKEIKSTMEEEKKAAVTAAKQQMESDKNKAVEETKKKQWCANCSKEAMFYCCWNTSYCDYPCQQAHWPQHMNVCTQTQAPQSAEQPTILPETINAADIPLADPGWKNNARDSLSAVLKRQEHERQQHQQQQQQRPPSQFGPSVSSSNPVYIHPQMMHSQNMQNPVVQYVPQSMSQPMMRQPGMNYQTPQQQMAMAGQPVMQQRPMMQPGGVGGPVMYLRPQQPHMLGRQPSPGQQSVGMMRPSTPQPPVGMMRGSPMYQPRSF